MSDEGAYQKISEKTMTLVLRGYLPKLFAPEPLSSCTCSIGRCRDGSRKVADDRIFVTPAGRGSEVHIGHGRNRSAGGEHLGAVHGHSYHVRHNGDCEVIHHGTRWRIRGRVHRIVDRHVRRSGQRSDAGVDAEVWVLP